MIAVRTIYAYILTLCIFLTVPFSTWAKPGVRHEELTYAPCTSDTVSKEEQEKKIKRHVAGQARAQMLKKIAQNPQLFLHNSTTPGVPNVFTQDVEHCEQRPSFLSTVFSNVKHIALYTYVLKPVWEKIFGSPLTPPAALAESATAQEVAAHATKVAAYNSALQAQQAACQVAQKTGISKLPYLQEQTAQVLLSSSKLLAFIAASTALHTASSAVGFTGWCQKKIYGDDVETVAHYNDAYQQYEKRIEEIRNARANGVMSIRNIPAPPEMPLKAVIKTTVLPYLLPLAVVLAEYVVLSPYIDKAVLGLLT